MKNVWSFAFLIGLWLLSWWGLTVLAQSNLLPNWYADDLDETGATSIETINMMCLAEMHVMTFPLFGLSFLCFGMLKITRKAKPLLQDLRVTPIAARDVMSLVFGMPLGHSLIVFYGFFLLEFVTCAYFDGFKPLHGGMAVYSLLLVSGIPLFLASIFLAAPWLGAVPLGQRLMGITGLFVLAYHLVLQIIILCFAFNVLNSAPPGMSLLLLPLLPAGAMQLLLPSSMYSMLIKRVEVFMRG